MSGSEPPVGPTPPLSERDGVPGALFESAPSRMAVLDGDGVIVAVNAAWRRAAAEAGRAYPSAGVGSTYVEAACVPGDEDAAVVAEGLAAILAGEAALFEHDYACPAAERPERWFTVTLYPIAGSGPARVMAVHNETTGAQRTRRALAEARRQQWLILEQASDGALITDLDGRIQQANRRAAEIFGYGVDELRGMHLAQLIEPADLERRPLVLVRQVGGETRLERQGQRRDGSTFTYEVSYRGLDDGRVLGLVRDISGRRRAADELRRQARLLTERVKEQRCLYAVSRALAEGGADLASMLSAVAAELPAGWSYPALARVRITLDSVTVESPGFAPAPRRQRAPLRLDGEVRGWIEVVYLEAPPDAGAGGRLLGADEAEPGEAGWFVAEERSLLDEVAARVTDAVRRHRAEARLRSSEAYFRALTEKGSDLVSITTAEGTLVYQSPALVEALGLVPEDRVGKSIFERIHPDDLERVRTEFARTLGDPGHQPTVEFRVRHSDGSWRVFESTGRNLLEDPAVAGVVVESRDVTASWEVREQIRFQAQILDLVGQAVVATDMEGRITYWNRAAEAIYGWAREEAIGRSIQETIPLDATQASAGDLLEAVDRGDLWAGELLAARRDGSRFPALVVDTPIHDARGTLIGYVAVATDISDRKEAELALRASEEWSRALIEQSSDLTVVLDPDGRILYTSPNRERILGTSAEAVAGADASELLLVHPEDRGDARRWWNAVYDAPGATVRAVLRVAHAGGSWRTLECSARNLLDNPAVQGVVVNARDVTDRVQLEHQLQQAQKMEAIGRLAGGVAHDFNNILTGIQGYTQLSLEELPEDHTARANLEEVARSAERAAGLTRQLLAFSRRQMMQSRVVDPNEAVGELRRMLTRVIGEDVELSTELAPDAGCILVDPGQLEQVILNLAVNARDAMPVGGRLTIRTARVRLSGRDLADAEGLEPGEYVELGVSDTGDGMATDVMERLFEPFFTTKELGKGTGLGLSTVYGIIKQSGGHIRVESFPGAGTTFQVYFPAVAGRPEETQARPPIATAHGGETVLLAEDDPAVRGLATRILTRAGYRVLEARNGAEAWTVFGAEPDVIDLVLSDVVMPELGGRELVERITAHRPGMPVILMSGYTDDVILRHGAREVGAAFLEKPFTPSALLEQVRHTLDGVIAGGGGHPDDLPAGP